jgi:hypothetical protein
VPAQPHGSSSGAGFGFWHLSARVGTRRLRRFQGCRRFICIKSMRRTMLVCAIHPPASPAIGQICGVLWTQVDEQSELETRAGEDRAAESDKYMPEGVCPASNSCWIGRGARARHRLLRRWPSRTHRIRCGASLGPLGPLRESNHPIVSICPMCGLRAISRSSKFPRCCVFTN